MLLHYYAIGIFIAATLNIYFGALVYFRGSKALPNLLYTLFSLSFAIWGYSWFIILELSGRDTNLAYFFARLLNFGAIFIPILYFHWIASLLKVSNKYKKILTLGYVMSSIFAFLCWTPWYIKGVHSILFFSNYPSAGPLYKYYIFFGYVAFFLLGLYLLLKSFWSSKSTDFKRRQIKFIILGTLTGVFTGFMNFPFMYELNPFGPLATFLVLLFLGLFIPSPLILSYAIIRYRLMDVKIIFTELSVGAIAMALLVLPFLMPTIGLRIITVAVFLAFLVFGYYLVRAIHREESRREEAERFNQAKTEFLAVTSHQLRTPLTAIRGYLSMVRRNHYGPLPKYLVSPLEEVYQSTLRLVKLTNLLLNISRIETGRLKMNLQEISLVDLIKSIIRELKPQAEEKGLYLRLKKVEEEIPPCRLDSEKIRQVFLNIIDNGLKYTRKGGVEISLRLIGFSKVRIKIQDTGEGMTKKELEKIFQSFSRGLAGEKFHSAGAGLGLYVAKEFVKMHQGKIWATSPGKGEGSTFWIELPLQAKEDSLKSDIQSFLGKPTGEE